MIILLLLNNKFKKIIKYEYLFSSKSEEKFNERFNNFEKLFNLREIICKYITYLSKKFKYEKKQGDEPAENTNTADPSLPPSNYTLSSINIVSSLFHKVGYEVFNLNENLIINDFRCNNCDMTQMAVSFGHQGNIKINFLNNLISKKKTDSLLTLMEKDELDNWEQSYKNSYVNDYFTSLEQQIQENYNLLLLNNKFKKIIMKFYPYYIMEYYFQEKHLLNSPSHLHFLPSISTQFLLRNI